MLSHIVVPFTIICALAATALAAPPTTTNPMHSLLGIQSIDSVQESAVNAEYYKDASVYHATLAAQATGFPAHDLANAAPSSATSALKADPGFFFASIAQAQSSDRPSWFNAMPKSAQDFYRSAGRKQIEIYTSDLKQVDPTALIDSSIVTSILPSSSQIVATVEASASDAAHAAATQAAKSVAATSPRGISSNVAVAVTGVVLAASLMGLAML
ncbi:MAG: hypothetical protein Q9214_006631 [Letrouitia sp. 1 TL-2023]